MPKIFINGKEIEFDKGMTVLQACELADVEIPRFGTRYQSLEIVECALEMENLLNQ